MNDTNSETLLQVLEVLHNNVSFKGHSSSPKFLNRANLI
jgi:hypothetical protein